MKSKANWVQQLTRQDTKIMPSDIPDLLKVPTQSGSTDILPLHLFSNRHPLYQAGEPLHWNVSMTYLSSYNF